MLIVFVFSEIGLDFLKNTKRVRDFPFPATKYITKVIVGLAGVINAVIGEEKRDTYEVSKQGR